MPSDLILGAEVTTGEPSLTEVSVSLCDAPGLVMAFKDLWEPWTEKNNPGNLCSRGSNGRNYFPLSGASRARRQKDLCLLWDAEQQSSFWSTHRTQQPHLLSPCTLTHLCPPCFLSHLQSLDTQQSLGVLEERHHMGIRIGINRCRDTIPSAGIKDLTCWPRRTSVSWLTLGT